MLYFVSMLDKTDKELAEKLKAFRIDRELTFEELSITLKKKISASTLYRFIEGRHKPNDITRKRIQDALARLDGGMNEKAS